MTQEDLFRLTYQVLQKCDNSGLNDILHATEQVTRERSPERLKIVAGAILEIIINNYGDLQPGSSWLVTLNDQGREIKQQKLPQ